MKNGGLHGAGERNVDSLVVVLPKHMVEANAQLVVVEGELPENSCGLVVVVVTASVHDETCVEEVTPLVVVEGVIS